MDELHKVLATPEFATNDLRNTNGAAVRDFLPAHQDTYPAIDPRLLARDLANKSVVVTGASRGIGRATAVALARAGCRRIAIAARSVDDLAAVEDEMRRASAEEGDRMKGRVLVVVRGAVDVTKEEDVRRFVGEVERGFEGGNGDGRPAAVDVLVNNAGYLEKWVPFGESDPKDWWHSWDVNIRGMYLCARFFMPLVLASETKTIINMTSTGANFIAAGASAYQTSKMAVCRLSEFMAADHFEDGLVAVALHPGSVPTNLAYGMPKEIHSVLTDTPELPAGFIVWLCVERREWLRGRYLSANWDVDALVAKRGEIVERDLLKFRLVI